MPRLDRPITHSLLFALAILLAQASQESHIAAQTRGQRLHSRLTGKQSPPLMDPPVKALPLPAASAPQIAPVIRAIHRDHAEPANANVPNAVPNAVPGAVPDAVKTSRKEPASEARQEVRTHGTKLGVRPTKNRVNASKSEASNGLPKTLFTVASSLAVVIGLFLIVAWLTKRKMPRQANGLPSEVIEVLGRVPLVPRQEMQLVRVGKKLLLISVTSTGAETLTEITDSTEVERLTSAAQQGRTGSVTATFRDVLKQLGSETAPKGFWGSQSRHEQLTAAISRDTKSSPKIERRIHG